MENDKVALDFTTISRVLKAFPFPEVDHVVGIATGGIVPASLIAHQLNLPMSLIEINYRARDNSPRYPKPVLLSWQPLPAGGRRRPTGGRSLGHRKDNGVCQDLSHRARGHHLCLKGTGGYDLFPDIESCVNWPCKLESQG